MTLQDLFGTVHYTDPSWPALDTPPDNPDGTPGWDTPATRADPDDDDDDCGSVRP